MVGGTNRSDCRETIVEDEDKKKMWGKEEGSEIKTCQCWKGAGKKVLGFHFSKEGGETIILRTGRLRADVTSVVGCGGRAEREVLLGEPLQVHSGFMETEKGWPRGPAGPRAFWSPQAGGDFPKQKFARAISRCLKHPTQQSQKAKGGWPRGHKSTHW